MCEPGFGQGLHRAGIAGAITKIKSCHEIVHVHIFQHLVESIRAQGGKRACEVQDAEQVCSQRFGGSFPILQALDMLQRFTGPEHCPGIGIEGQHPPEKAQAFRLFLRLSQQGTMTLVKSVKESCCQDRMGKAWNTGVGKPEDLHHHNPLAQANTSP